MKKKSILALCLIVFVSLSGAAAYRLFSEKAVTENAIKPAAMSVSKQAKPASKLKALYDTYKHVEKVELRDGTVLFGVMHETDDRIGFITPDGTLQLSRDDIIRVEYLNPDTI